jgi:MarR family transcriptional regulator, 2-MHQ and catechol-resistance regulon repressor
MEENGRTLYFSLKSIFLHIDNQEKALLSRFKINIPRFYIMMHVYNKPGINYIELSELMLCTKGNTTRVVQAMQREDLLTRQVNNDDRRSYNLFLSKKGEYLFKEVYSAYIQHIDQMLAKFSEDQLVTYTTVSDHIEKVFQPTK